MRLAALVFRTSTFFPHPVPLAKARQHLPEVDLLLALFQPPHKQSRLKAPDCLRIHAVVHSLQFQDQTPSAAVRTFLKYN